jgi:hypothetical protein
VYYTKADNIFIVKLNEDDSHINHTIEHWKTEQDGDILRYVIFYHSILEEEIRINEPKWL